MTCRDLLKAKKNTFEYQAIIYNDEAASVAHFFATFKAAIAEILKENKKIKFSSFYNFRDLINNTLESHCKFKPAAR